MVGPLLPKPGEVTLPAPILSWLNERSSGASAAPEASSDVGIASRSDSIEGSVGSVTDDRSKRVPSASAGSATRADECLDERVESDPDFLVTRKQTSGGECLTFVTQLPAPGAPKSKSHDRCGSSSTASQAHVSTASDLDGTEVGNGKTAAPRDIEPVVLVLFGSGSMAQADIWLVRVVARALFDHPSRALWAVRQELRSLMGQNIPNRWRIKVRYGIDCLFTVRSTVVSRCLLLISFSPISLLSGRSLMRRLQWLSLPAAWPPFKRRCTSASLSCAFRFWATRFARPYVCLLRV